MMKLNITVHNITQFSILWLIHTCNLIFIPYFDIIYMYFNDNQ